MGDRIEDLGPEDFVKVECVCGHDLLIPSIGLQRGLKLPPYMPVLDAGSAAASAIGVARCRSSGPISSRRPKR
jgi:hypothetical protein